jgi:hypothetical protein
MLLAIDHDFAAKGGGIAGRADRFAFALVHLATRTYLNFCV